MIYIENNLEKQDVFIPRNDGSTCYVSPYDKGYQDGYQDGIEDCGDCPIQQKEVVLTATTETISPDQGYAGMDSVFVDARQLALEKYNEGYHEGEEDGAEEQKDKLASTAFTQNGIYTREDGWNEVEVDVPKDINLGTLVESPQMSDITYGLYIKTFDPQEASVDGWGEIRLYMDTLIGQSKDEQKALMTGTTFTQNGLYRREDGWNEVIVEVPQTGTSCNLESKTETVTADTQTILPSSGYDGMSEVVVDATDYGQDKYDEGFADGQASVPPCPPCPEIESGVTYGIGSGFTGATVTPSSGYDGMAEVTITDNGYGQEKYNEGFTDGQTDILSGLTDTTIRQNGSYSNPSGWSGVTVDVQPTLEAASYALPSGFTGTTIVPSSGYDGMSSVVITDGGYGQERYDEGYQDGLGDCPAPNLEQKSVTLTATTECFTPSSGYDGFSEVCVDATDIYNQGYNDGYNDAGGFDDGYNEGIEDGIWSNEYLTFEAIQNGGIELYSASSPASWHIDNPEFLQIDYSINGGPWTTITSLDKLSHTGSTLPSFTPQITVSAGDIVRVRGLNNSYVLNYPNAVSIINHFRITPCYVYGNIMSLIYGDNFVGKTAFPNGTSRNFYFLFFLYMDTVHSIYNMNGVYSHPTKRLVLPATSLTDGCYTRLFSGTYIDRAPNLPATVLTSGCYSYMFAGCTGLTNTPKLPAKMIARDCYNGMFMDCTSLTTAPALPATTLANSCYRSMFAGCTGITTAPELLATSLESGSYGYMFQGCTNLNYVKCLAQYPYANNSTAAWLNAVSAQGTFVKDANATWRTGDDGIPSGWTVLNA